MRPAYREMRLVRAQFADLGALRRFVSDACAEAQASAAARDALELAVDEACTNIVEHGYHGTEAGPLALEFECDGEELRVCIADRGRPFPPERALRHAPQSRLSARTPGGLGWHFIQSVVDALHYETDVGGTNRLILVKRCT